MAVEVQPARGALWFDNWTLQATIAAFSGQSSDYQASATLNPQRSDTYRSPDATSDTYVVYDMGQIRTPSGLALMNPNFSQGPSIRFRGSDDAAQVTNPVYWDLPLYAADAIGQLVKWYLGTPSGGSIGASTNPADAAAIRGRQFWGVRILPSVFGSYNMTDDFFEFGVPFIGPYTPIRPWDGVKPKPKNNSNTTEAYGGAPWTDPMPATRNVDVPTGGLTVSDYYALEAKILAQGKKFTLLDLWAYSTDPVLKNGGSMYGMFADSPLDGDVGSPENNSLSFSFEEKRG